MLAPLTATSATALLSPSARVLAACSAPDAGISRALALPWSDVHWPTLVALATWERAASPLYRLLRAAPAGGVPADVLQAVQGIARVAEFRAGELSEAAGESVDALQAAGIEALWLKGAALAMQSPLGFALRAMGDIDVLVAPSQLEPARAALLGAGWGTGPAAAGYDLHHHAAPLVRRGDLRLELHGAMLPTGHPFVPDAAMAWMARGVDVSWGPRRRLRVLPPAWHVVHASVHWAWSHEGEVGTWQYLHDAQRLAAAGLDWNEVVRAARELGADAVVGMALWSASVLSAANIPDAVVLQLRGRPQPLDGLAERAWIIRAFQSPMASPSVAWSRFWWRRAVRGTGDAAASWPWAAGRDQVVAPSVADGSDGRRGGRFVRWRRHLGRVLRG